MGGSRLPDGLENPLWGTDVRSPPKKMMTIFEAVQAAKEKRKLALGSSVDVPIQVASPLLVNSPSIERGDAKKSPRWNLLRAGGAAAVATGATAPPAPASPVAAAVAPVAAAVPPVAAAAAPPAAAAASPAPASPASPASPATPKPTGSPISPLPELAGGDLASLDEAEPGTEPVAEPGTEPVSYATLGSPPSSPLVSPPAPPPRKQMTHA